MRKQLEIGFSKERVAGVVENARFPPLALWKAWLRQDSFMLDSN